MKYIFDIIAVFSVIFIYATTDERESYGWWFIGSCAYIAFRLILHFVRWAGGDKRKTVSKRWNSSKRKYEYIDLYEDYDFWYWGIFSEDMWATAFGGTVDYDEVKHSSSEHCGNWGDTTDSGFTDSSDYDSSRSFSSGGGFFGGGGSSSSWGGDSGGSSDSGGGDCGGGE